MTQSLWTQNCSDGFVVSARFRYGSSGHHRWDSCHS